MSHIILFSSESWENRDLYLRQKKIVILNLSRIVQLYSLSGYKINWRKSVLMPINNVKVNSSIPSFIPIKESFIYLGITIYKNIHKIARDNLITF